MAGFSREVARRVFAEELKRSNYTFREGEDQHQYAPQYLLTPTGAKCNRVLIVGTLTEKDDIGGDTEYWRGRIVDPTGSILIYAGQYQPESAQLLANMEIPAFVAVVGKPNLYQTEDGNVIISLRAESIQNVDESTRNQWVMDTAWRTWERILAMKNFKPSSALGDFETADSVSASEHADDVERAILHYHTDVEQFRQMVTRALSVLKTDLTSNRAETEKASVSKSKIIEHQPNEQQETAEVNVAKSKGVGSLDAWPKQEDDDSVEIFNLKRKS